MALTKVQNEMLTSGGGGGMIGSNAVSYTPIFTNLGTCTNIVAYTRRVGPNLEGQIKFTAGTVAAGSPTMTLGYNGSNSNVTIASTMGSGNNIVGLGGQNSNSQPAYTVLAQNGGGTLSFSCFLTGVSALGNPNASSMFVSSQDISFTFSVPISGWNWDS